MLDSVMKLVSVMNILLTLYIFKFCLFKNVQCRLIPGAKKFRT
jgi:hypothetical protein